MKNISYLLLVSILFFSNCSNDNGVEEMLTEPIKITEADLVGDWIFVSLEFKDTIYTECDDELRKKYDLTNLSFFNVTLESELYGVPSLIYFSNCGNITSPERRFNIKDNYIYLHNQDKLKYLILNSQTFNRTTLKIKLITDVKSIPAGGIYTLKRI